MTWSVIVDPAAVASGAPGFRTQLDLNNGPIRVDQKGLDWGDSQMQTYLADQRVGSTKVDYRMPNRKVTIPLFLMDDNSVGGSGITEEQARVLLQEKVGLLQMRGGWLMRQRAGGNATYADVVDAVLTLPDVWGETGGVEPNIVLVLECSPDFYGDPITLDIATVTSAQLSGPLKSSGSNAVIQGDQMGRAQILVTDTSGLAQGSLIWGFRSTYYDSASTAQLIYESENLGPVSPSATATVAGRSGVSNTALTTSWRPIVNTNIGGTTPMTHLGSYRVRARAYTTSATDVWLRLIWGVGAAVGLVTNPLVLMPGANNFFIVDLGEVRIDWPPVGSTRWEGQIQALGQVGGENVFVDQIYLQPLDDAAGYAVANPNVTALTSPFANDTFSQSAGNLNGKTATLGGTWAENAPPITSSPDGFNPPALMANATGAGPQAWQIPYSVTGGPGTVSSPEALIDTPQLPTHTASQYIQSTGFGFAVPTTATIVGVEVEFNRVVYGPTSAAGPVTDATSGVGGHAGVVLCNGATVLGTDQSTGATWPLDTPIGGPGMSGASFGSPTNVWGATLTPAIVNSPTFGFNTCCYNGGSGTAQVMVANELMRVWYTTSVGLYMQVGTGAVTRAVGDSAIHFAVLGTTTSTDVDLAADMGFTSYPTSANGGLLARYVDTNNYLAAYVYSATVTDTRGLPVPQCQLLVFLSVSTGGARWLINQPISFPPALPSTFNLRMLVTSIGQVQVFINSALVATATATELATGGALASGKIGLYQYITSSSVPVQWDNFVVYSAVTGDAVVFGHASAALRHDGMYRADSSNLYYGPIAQVVGDLPRVPPSGVEGRPVELFLLVSRGDLKTQPDVALASFTAQVTYRPVRVHRA